MHEEVLLAEGQGGLKAGKYHWMLHAYIIPGIEEEE